MKKLFQKINDNKQLRNGIILLTFLLIVAIMAPVLATYDPFKLNDDILAHPGGKYLLGTDGLGRDVFSGILYGARTSILVGVIAAVISAVIGIIIGGLAGYLGGKVDMVISEIINIFLMLPTFFLILIVVALFGSNLFNMMIIIGLTTWTKITFNLSIFIQNLIKCPLYIF